MNQGKINTILSFILSGIILFLMYSVYEDHQVLNESNKHLKKVVQIIITDKINAERKKEIHQNQESNTSEATKLYYENFELYETLLENKSKEVLTVEVSKSIVTYYLKNGIEYLNVVRNKSQTQPWDMWMRLDYLPKYLLEKEISLNKTLDQNNFYVQLLKTALNPKARNADKINLFYESNKTVLFAAISLENYESLSYFVEALIASYDNIKATPDHESILEKLNLEADKVYQIEGIKEIYPDLYENYQKISGTSQTNRSWDKEYIKWFNEWINTFWIRRYKEKNSETVYNILVEIQTHYAMAYRNIEQE